MQTPQFVDFETSDGLTLPGLLYEAKRTKRVVIYLHGNGSSSVFYDEKDFRDLPEALNKKGVSILKFNNRGANVIKRFTIKKNGDEERVPFGMAYEKIKDCVFDIEAAIKFLQKLGYKEFYLAGTSTGANKICVYDHYKPENIFKKYVLICGGDDTGIYYSLLGDKKFFKVLNKAKEKIDKGEGLEIAPETLPIGEVFSYQGFYDIANPDGDYNCFPFSEVFKGVKISTKPLFRYFKSIKTPSIVIYGEKDEYTWGNINKVIDTLKKYQPSFEYKVISSADHRFTGKHKDLAKIVADWL
jgi:pimeloyl-ACP methyl ester carboxylesterase